MAANWFDEATLLLKQQLEVAPMRAYNAMALSCPDVTHWGWGAFMALCPLKWHFCDASQRSKLGFCSRCLS